MSDTAFECNVDTRVSEHSFDFKWKIYEFSKATEKLTSSPFAFASEYPEEWFFTLVPKEYIGEQPVENAEECAMEVVLNYANESQKSLQVSYEFSTDDCEFKNVCGSHWFKANSTEKVICPITKNKERFENALGLKCSLKVYGYSIKTRFNQKVIDFEVEEMQSNMLTMLKNVKGTDVLIICQGKIIVVHRFMLAQRLPDFLKIHASALEMDCVDMGDTDHNTFKALLQYVYSAKVDEFLIHRQTQELYNLSCKYDLPGLKRICSLNLDPDAVSDLYDDDEFVMVFDKSTQNA